MRDFLKLVCKFLFLYMFGGATYYFIEILWRGYSHPSMFALGGWCFIVLGNLNEDLSWDLGLLWQTLIGTGIITTFELIAGIVVNLWLDLGVWDYSNLPLNFMGQICVPYMLLWIPLSGVAIIADDYIRYWFFNEEKPHYRFL